MRGKDSNEKFIMDVDPIQTKSKNKYLRYSFEIKIFFHEMIVVEGFSSH